MAEKHGNGCDHGWVETEDYRIIADFAKTFVSGHQSVPRDAKMGERFEAGRRASKEKYPEVWDDPSKLKRVVNYFISNGTQQVLKGNNYGARGYAFLACYFEEYISVYLHQTKGIMDATKVIELANAGDEHTVVKYLKKRVPCTCLDEKYKEVKSITKMGSCRNPECKVPGKMVERSKMLYCTRCRQVNYCSPECQKAAWPRHKKVCDMHVHVRGIAKLDSR